MPAVWATQSLSKVHGLPLDGAGLLALADISTSARKTALSGSASLYDVLSICPGLHKQQDAPKLSNGEYPACAAMTTGYVFRVENEATVFYMQRMSRTGQLTTLSVTDAKGASFNTPRAPTLLYQLPVVITMVAVKVLYDLRDWWAIGCLAMFAFVRLINVMIIRRRATPGWKGQEEPGVESDLLVLLSQDRWIRLRGLTDDIKLVTSGEWLRESSPAETLATTIATMLVYLTAGLMSNAGLEGKVILVALMFLTAVQIELANGVSDQLKMHGKAIRMSGERKAYKRRLHMAHELVKEVGRSDWCAKMGMVVNKEDLATGPVIM